VDPKTNIDTVKSKINTIRCTFKKLFTPLLRKQFSPGLHISIPIVINESINYKFNILTIKLIAFKIVTTQI